MLVKISRSVATIPLKSLIKARYSSAFSVEIFVLDFKILNYNPYKNTLQYVALRDEFI